MSLKVACEHCGKVYALDASLAGKKARCGNCRQSFRIPAAGALPVSDSDFSDADVIADAPPARFERITLRGEPPVWPTEPEPGFPTGPQIVLLAVGAATVALIVLALLFVPSKELRNDPNDVAPRWLGLLILAFGTFIGWLSIGNFDLFFEARRIKILSLLFGRMGARVVIMMIGGVALAVGIDMAAGGLPRAPLPGEPPARKAFHPRVVPEGPPAPFQPAPRNVRDDVRGRLRGPRMPGFPPR